MSAQIEDRYRDLGGPNGMLGQPSGAEQQVGAGRMRKYANGAIYASDVTGAQVLTGQILSSYAAHGGPTGPLVFPTSDVEDVKGGQLATFQGGGIFTSRAGTFSVDGPLFLRYMHLDGPTGLLGFPIADTKDTPGGKRSEFEHGAIYWSPTTGAHELHGAILDRFRSLGGTRSFLGFPLNDESDVLAAQDVGAQGVVGSGRITAAASAAAAATTAAMPAVAAGTAGRGRRPAATALTVGGTRPRGPGTRPPVAPPVGPAQPQPPPRRRVLGRYNRFSGGVIYWSATSGAWELHGEIRDLYEKLGGPTGSLGFPITNEEQHASGVRYNNFQKGVIVWRPGMTRAVTAIQLSIGRVTSSSIDDGRNWYGTKDKTAELVTYTTVRINGTTIEDRKRRPSGHAGTSYEIKARHAVNVVQANTEIYFKVDVDDWDKISGNDYLGSHERTLTIADCWGMLDGEPPGYYRLPSTRKGGDAPSLSTLQFTYSITDRVAIDPNAHFREQFWWRSDNFGTPQLTKLQYANTFRDVEQQTNWIDVLTNPFDAAYYELAYKGVAKTGNCFGMSLEAAYAKAGESIFPEPIYPVQTNGTDSKDNTPSNIYVLAKEQFNYRHAFQLGASAIDWVLLKLLTPGALEPMAVFNRVAACLRSGDQPLISMVKISEGKGHTMLPYRADPASGRTPARIFVADPNVPWRTKADDPTYIEISGDQWKFVHGGLSSDYASSGKIAGLLPKVILLETPFHVVDSQPRTPFWEVLLALIGLTGGLFLLFGDAEVDQVDSGGRVFYKTVNGTRGIDAGGAGGLARIPLLDAGGALPEIYAHRGPLPAKLTFTLRGGKAGTVRHVSAVPGGAIRLAARTSAGDRDDLVFGDPSLPTPTIGISGSAPKTWEVVHAAHLERRGLSRRAVRAEIDVSAGATARVSLAHRAGAIEVEAPGAGAVRIEVATFENDAIKRAKFSLARQPGVTAYRLRPDWSSISSPGTVEDLTAIRGNVLASRAVQPT